MQIKEENLGTDITFLRFMKVSGKAILNLIGVKNPANYQVKATVLKDKSLFPDIESWPLLEAEGDRIIIEFQGYGDSMIRYKLCAKMAMYCTSEDYSGPIFGVIIFTDQASKNYALPLEMQDTQKRFKVEGNFLEICLEDYTEAQLLAIDPHLVPFIPFTLKKNLEKSIIRQKSQEWKAKIQQTFPKTISNDVLEILTLFILHRFRNISYEEGFEMFNLNLAETRAGQDLIQIGKLILAREAILDNIQNRFGEYPNDLAQTLEKITDLKQLKFLHSQTLKCKTLDSFQTQLKEDQ